ncbi:MAG: patatin-like phospholipase family protein [Victivallales bacterium]|nr:patatin-like phospholipase family protein [Victivallales bacterium]
MRNKIYDGDDGIGLVLSGGGAKGAFQIGAWEAMCELGLAKNVTAISGTSVGAINGVAIATGNSIEKMKRLWGQAINDVCSADFERLIDQVPALVDSVISFINGAPCHLPALLNRSRIEAILRELIPLSWPSNAPVLHTTSLKVVGNYVGNSDERFRLTRFDIGGANGLKERICRILASAAMPWGFPPVEIDGEKYVDGGWNEKGGENNPVTPILEEHPELKTVFVVRCNSADVDKSQIRRPRGVNVVEIRPKKSLPGIFDAYLDDILKDPFYDYLSELAFPDLKNKLRIWSGTLAFDRKFTEQYIKDGYDTAMEKLQSL